MLMPMVVTRISHPSAAGGSVELVQAGTAADVARTVVAIRSECRSSGVSGGRGPNLLVVSGICCPRFELTPTSVPDATLLPVPPAPAWQPGTTEWVESALDT